MTSPRGTAKPSTTVVGTAAVTRRLHNYDDGVLAGSGLLMAAVLVALDHQVTLACHVGDDEDGDRIRSWAADHDVDLFGTHAGQPSVRLTEHLTAGEGTIVDGDSDPGPTREDLRTAMQGADIVLIGHLSASVLTRVLDPSVRIVAPDALLVANMSSAWVDTWPTNATLWKQADIVTIGQPELARLGLNSMTARHLCAPASTLIVTNAGTGPVGIYTDSDHHVRVPSLPAIVDTMGSGDALAATFAALRHDGHSPREAAQRAIRAAQRKCMTDDIEGVPRAAWADIGRRMLVSPGSPCGPEFHDAPESTVGLRHA